MSNTSDRIDYSELCPTRCAERALDQLGITDDTLKQAIRNVVREAYEHCARVTQDWVSNHDRDEKLRARDVGDKIAAELRRIGEERSQTARNLQRRAKRRREVH